LAPAKVDYPSGTFDKSAPIFQPTQCKKGHAMDRKVDDFIFNFPLIKRTLYTFYEEMFCFLLNIGQFL